MTEQTCDRVCEAAMALFDGEPSELGLAAIENHLAICATCGEHIEQLKNLATSLSLQERREQTADLWPAIRQELEKPESGSTPVWRAFVLLAILLPGYRLVEIVPRVELSTFFKLIPVLLAIGVFYYLRENPFKINTLLRLEED